MQIDTVWAQKLSCVFKTMVLLLLLLLLLLFYFLMSGCHILICFQSDYGLYGLLYFYFSFFTGLLQYI